MTVYRHISAKKATGHPVSVMCELLGVSESGYWAWMTRAPSDRALADAWLTERIRRIHAVSGGRYGNPRVHAMLAREGIRVGEKRVARLMRAAGLQGAFKRRRKGCTVRVAASSRSLTSSAATFGPTPKTGRSRPPPSASFRLLLSSTTSANEPNRSSGSRQRVSTSRRWSWHRRRHARTSSCGYPLRSRSC